MRPGATQVAVVCPSLAWLGYLTKVGVARDSCEVTSERPQQELAGQEREPKGAGRRNAKSGIVGYFLTFSRTVTTLFLSGVKFFGRSPLSSA